MVQVFLTKQPLYNISAIYFNCLKALQFFSNSSIVFVYISSFAIFMDLIREINKVLSQAFTWIHLSSVLNEKSKCP